MDQDWTARELESAIATCEAAGMVVHQPRDTPDEQLRKMWNQITSVTQMAEDIAKDGAKLTFRYPHWISEGAGAAYLRDLRNGIVRRIDTILTGAVVVREAADD